MSNTPLPHRRWTIEKRPGRWTLSDDDEPDAKKRAMLWGEAGTGNGTLGLYAVISHCISNSDGLPGIITIRYLPAWEPLVLRYEAKQSKSADLFQG